MVMSTSIIKAEACTQTFEKGGSNIRFYTKGSVNLKTVLILRPKLGV